MRFLILALAASTSASAAIDFNKEIRPILQGQCLSCHSSSRAAGGLAVDNRQAVLKAIVPGNPETSKLMRVVELPPSKPGAMPPGGAQLTTEQRTALRTWIAEGAKWPEGVVLKSAPASKLDEKQVVDALHKKIVARTREKSPADMKPYKEGIPGTDVMFEMTPIPAGEFTMGTADSEKGRKSDEGPTRKMRIDPFWMGVREVTWDEYRLFMINQQDPLKDALVDAVARPTRPYVEMSFGMGINGFPAISMTHHAANKYAEWLSAKTGYYYRLPTEAEWEYACRAGTQTAYSFGGDESKLGDYAWFSANSNDKYQPVGTKKPNAWGLYDMHGNVMEWTLDQYGPYTTTSAPWVPSTKPYPHVARGGSWADGPSNLRCGARVASDPSWKQQDPQLPKSIWYHTDAQWLGLRMVRPLKIPNVLEMYRSWNNGVEKE